VSQNAGTRTHFSQSLRTAESAGQHLQDRGIADQTMIVLTSDHGDYLHDHWLGEKELFHDEYSPQPFFIQLQDMQPA
jgi:arylsulfatase A-like enzyme